MEGNSIPEELEIEVLLRLPVKSLLRFNTVCKKWHSLFRNPNFINRYNHLANSRSTGKLLCFRQDPITKSHLVSLFDDQTSEKLEDLEWPPFPDEGIQQNTENFHRCIQILGPVNGVYCIYNRLVERWIGTLVLWNPATRDYKHILPPISYPFPPHLVISRWNPYFDPDSSIRPVCMDLGFGFDRNNINDYKVIVICQWQPAYHDEYDDSWHARVYNSASDSWKTICSLDYHDKFPQLDLDYPPFPWINSFPSSFCLVNGVYHWSCEKLYHELDEGNFPILILAFDFADEAFQLIQGPPLSQDYKIYRSVRVLRDNLAMVAGTSWMKTVMDLKIWVMMEYGLEDSWVMLYSFEHIAASTVVGIPNSVRIFFTKADNDWQNVQLLSSSFVDDEVKEHDIYGCLQIITAGRWHELSLGIVNYVETLAPLKQIDHQDN